MRHRADSRPRALGNWLGDGGEDRSVVGSERSVIIVRPAFDGAVGNRAGLLQRAMSEKDCFLRSVKGAMLALALLMLAMTSGCFAAAVPVASGILRAAASGISSSARAAKNKQVGQHTELCDMGERPLPRLIELRTDKLGTTMYRPLNLGGSMTDPQRAVGQIGGLGAWRDLGDLAGMNFQPSLQSQLAPSSVIFLAYAPAQAHDSAEQSQLDALNHDFGPTSGIFDWDNRLFLYSAVHQLPCESSRVPAPTQGLGDAARPESPEQPEAPQ
jgi:hypothetical protein